MDWAIGSVYDIIRRRSMIVYQMDPRPTAANLDEVRQIQMDSVFERRWIYRRWKKPHSEVVQRMACDPNGRVFVAVARRGAAGVLGQFGEATDKVRYHASMEPWWAALKAFHGRLWEVTEDCEVESKDYKDAARLFIWAHKRRKAVGNAPLVGEGAVIRRKNMDSPWWSRFQHQLEVWEPPDIDKSKKLLRPRTKKVLTGSREITQLMLWMSWKEWDVDDPPMDFEPLRK